MPERFLFERLAGIDADAFKPRRAVRGQLERLFSSQPIEAPDDALAEGPHLLNFGLPAVVDLGFISSAERELYAEHLSAQIKAFEPRLVDPVVRFTGTRSENDPIGVEIEARLNPGEEEEIIRFNVGANGLEEG